ncbi:hypothetical protein BD414DRAFT_516736 [Trametes punicea]|nr:hypothetical protein BD414DRAFT_516736 [Trametes punicea]
MPSSSSSSNPVSDALQNLTRAATAAFSAVQEQAQAEIAQARAERDDALKALQEAQLDAKDLEMREKGWRAALEKSDLTIKHQAETIIQLRNDVDQWKTQLLRLEESSRQEIDDWKEQYRRAEHERSRLSARIDELIAGQLAWNAAAHAYNPPYTPRMAYTEISEPSTSSSAPKRASTTSHMRRTGGTPRRTARAPLDPDEARKPRSTAVAQGTHGIAQTELDHTSRSRGASPMRPTTARRKGQVAVEVVRTGANRSAPRTPAARASPAHREARSNTEPRQQVIRRVTAIVDVKEEEEEERLDDRASVGSGSVYEPDEEVQPLPSSNRRRRASNTSARRKQVVQEWDEDEQTPDVGDDEDQYGQEPEYEDDELLLGPKKSKLSAGNAKQRRTSLSGKGSGSAAKNLKRKIDVDTSASSGRAGPAKAAKTR